MISNVNCTKVNSFLVPYPNIFLVVMDNETFKLICSRVAQEHDPKIIEILKLRMQLLLSEKIPDVSRRQAAWLN
jgi:hypothetical protein